MDGLKRIIGWYYSVTTTSSGHPDVGAGDDGEDGESGLSIGVYWNPEPAILPRNRFLISNWGQKISD